MDTTEFAKDDFYECPFSMLKEAVVNQHKLINYLNTYINYLLGSLTEDEFEKYTSTIATFKKVISKEDADKAYNFFIKILPDIDMSDVAMLADFDFFEYLKLEEKK